MKVEIQRIGVLQAGWFLLMLYLLVALAFAPFLLIAILLGRGDPATLLGLIFYPAIGFIGGVIGAWLYNITARIVGGIKLEMRDEAAAAPVNPG